MSRGSSLVKNTVVIAFGKICTQFISFLLLPLYTSYLSASEYGIVDLYNTFISLLLPIATLMIEQGAFRYLVSRNEEGYSEYSIISSSFIIITVLNIVFVLLGVGFFNFYNNIYRYYLIPILVTASFSNWTMQLARGFKKLTIYSIGSVISASAQIICNVILISVINMGPRGMLIGTIIGNCANTLFLFFILHIYKFISLKSISKEISKKMLAYSLPLIPNTLSLWIINSSDRIIVSSFLGITANGLIAVSHKFPSIIQSLYSVFQLSWHELGAVHWNDSDRESFFNKAINTIVVLFACICNLVIGVIPVVYRIIIRNPDYAQAYNTIPIYIVAALFNVIVGLLGVVYVATKRTKEIAKTTIIAGFINIIIHLMLVNRIGLYAAAISTLVAYVSVTGFRMWDIRQYLGFQIDIKRMLVEGFVLVIICVCYYQYSTGFRITGLVFSIVASLYLCKDSFMYVAVLMKKKTKCGNKS